MAASGSSNRIKTKRKTKSGALVRANESLKTRNKTAWAWIWNFWKPDEIYGRISQFTPTK